MVGEPDPVRIDGLAFDDWNEEHLAVHGVTRNDVEEVLDNSPAVFRNLPDPAGSHVMIGANNADRFFYMGIGPTRESGVWYPITGWSLNRRRALHLMGGV